ncbi:MAG: patatin-like phospholipase family protein [Rickettsiales bacterium]
MAAKKSARKKPVVPKKASVKKPKLELNLALQGGGAHGAFTWGVLDRILDEEDIQISGISGTSAGAMNAAVLVEGYNEGGRARAKEQLREFWQEISTIATSFAPFGQTLPSDMVTQIPGTEWLSALNPLDMVTRVFSPYEYNPLNYNPLRSVLERVLQPENLHKTIPLFVTATNVETGEARVFKGEEVTIDVLLASACLPFVYQAVEIDGVPYWDGGYMGNPAIWPLIYKTGCEDVLLVQINPLKRAGTPKHAIDIINRVNEISFNSSLIAEMRAIHFVQKLIKKGKLSSHEYSDMRIHRVMPPADLREMNAASKMNASWDFLNLLYKVGYKQMDDWLKAHKKHLGKSSTLDIEEHFLPKQRTKGEST